MRARRSTEWKGWNPDRHTASFASFAKHPQAIDQQYLVSWNNRQALGFAGPDENVFSSTYRSVLLEDPLKAKLRGGRKLTLPEVVDVMEVAGTGDLRAHAVLPLALRVIGRPKDAGLRQAVATLQAWRRAGGRRIDGDKDGVYEHSDAIRIMDAWWPRWVRAQFQPRMGKAAVDRLLATTQLDNAPNNHGDHLGSAYQGAWYGYVRKDLRTILGRKVKGRYVMRYCGGGKLRKCRNRLRSSLKAALKVPASALYGDDQVCQEEGKAGDQACYDAGPLPPGRRRHAAADPVDQPARPTSRSTRSNRACPARTEAWAGPRPHPRRSSRAMTSATRPTPSACWRSSSTGASGWSASSRSRSASWRSCCTARRPSSTRRSRGCRCSGG